jgi:hypothetical protein
MDIGDKVRIKELKTGGRIVAEIQLASNLASGIFGMAKPKRFIFSQMNLDITVPDPYAIKEEL